MTDRAKLIAALMADQPYAAFGTGSAVEENAKPSGLAELFSGAYNSLGETAKRAFGASEMMRTQGTYDPAPVVNAAMLPMGTGAITGVPIRAGESAFGSGAIRRLPSPDSLQALPHPSIENLQKLSRVESVDLAKARTMQDGRDGMNWEANRRGEYAPPLFEGYADKPVAVRKETGEYVILDGNHRSVNALNRGDKNLEMYVIDAKDYAPAFAGRKPADNTDVDALLKALLSD